MHAEIAVSRILDRDPRARLLRRAPGCRPEYSLDASGRAPACFLLRVGTLAWWIRNAARPFPVDARGSGRNISGKSRRSHHLAGFGSLSSRVVGKYNLEAPSSRFRCGPIRLRDVCALNRRPDRKMHETEMCGAAFEIHYSTLAGDFDQDECQIVDLWRIVNPAFQARSRLWKPFDLPANGQCFTAGLSAFLRRIPLPSDSALRSSVPVKANNTSPGRSSTTASS